MQDFIGILPVDHRSFEVAPFIVQGSSYKKKETDFVKKILPLLADSISDHDVPSVFEANAVQYN